MSVFRFYHAPLFMMLASLVSSPVRSAVVTATSGSQAAIQAAVNAAQPGDVVFIPAGVWNVQGTVVLKEGIHVRGAGRDSTILNRLDSASIPIFSLQAVTGAPFKVSDITFSGRGLDLFIADPSSTVVDTGIRILGKASGFEIFNCRFRRFTGNGIYINGSSGAPLLGAPRGVIHGNEFLDIYYSTSSGSLGYGVGVYGDSSWGALELGTGNAVFIEGNVFQRNRHCVASNFGSRYVFRHNTVTQNYAPAPAVDAHGRTTTSPGSRSFEVYNNSIGGGVAWPHNTPQATWAGGIRGGDGVIFNNTFTGSTAPLFLMVENLYGLSNPAYPAPDQTTDLWLWGNTLNGGSYNAVHLGYGDPQLQQDLIPFFQNGRDFHYAQKPGYAPYLYPHPVRGVAGWWRFDETSGTVAIDSSARGNNGAMVGAPVVGGGVMGRAREFNGTTGHVEIPHAASLNAASFTFSAWVRVTGNAGSYRAVVSSRDTAYRGYILYAGPNDTWQFWTGNGSQWPSLQGPAITMNSWTHLAGTFDGTTKRLYVNGALYGTQAMSSYSPNTARPLRIGAGANETNANFFFHGGIDDVRIFSRALSASEVSSLYVGAAARWTLDSVADSTAVDASDKGHGGVISGGASLIAGQVGNALSLDGTSGHVQVPYSPELNATPFTFSAWVRVTGNTNAYRAVLSSRDSGYRGYILYAGPNNTWQFWTGTGTQWPSLQGPAVAMNTWTHLAGTCDGTTKRLYVNGVLHGTQTVTSYQPNTARPFRIGAGANEGAATYFFHGGIDDARLYARVLSAAEILQLYTNP